MPTKTFINLTNPHFAAAVQAIFLSFQCGAINLKAARTRLKSLYNDAGDFESERERKAQFQIWLKLIDDVATIFFSQDPVDIEHAAQADTRILSGWRDDNSSSFSRMGEATAIQPGNNETFDLNLIQSFLASQDPTSRNVDLKGEKHTSLTLALVNRYSEDLVNSRRFILRQPAVPDIPSFLWDLILENKYADLDQVLRHVIGDGTFIVVETQDQWSRCWIVYSRAVMFAFPHRTSELFRYSNWISSLFSRMPEELYTSIIRMDAILRAQAVQDQQAILRFDDGSLAIQHLFTTVFQSDGEELDY